MAKKPFQTVVVNERALVSGKAGAFRVTIDGREHKQKHAKLDAAIAAAKEATK